MQQMFTCGNCGAPVNYGEPSCCNCGVPLDWSAQQMHDQFAPPYYDYQPPAQQQTWEQQPLPYDQQSWDQPPPYNQQPGWNQPPAYNQPPPGPGYPGQYRQKPPYGSRSATTGKKGFPYGIAIMLFLFVAILAVGGIGFATDWEFKFNSKQSASTGAGNGSVLPVISSFGASPASVGTGGTSNLQWDVTGSTSVSIDHGIGTVSSSGNHTVSPATTTTYKITATNGSGTVTKLITVTVTALDLPKITSFTATPGTVTNGMPTTLKWAVTGATSISIDKNVGNVSASGTKAVTPTATTTYTLTATNSSGSVNKSVTVTFTNKPIITAFTATPNSLNAGQSATLTWNVVGATTVSINQDIGDVSSSGTRSISPTATTAYTITATNSYGSTTAAASVNVTVTGKPVINSFTASYEKITTGLSSTLSWNVSGASAISIQPSTGDTITGLTATGTKVVEPTTTTTYTLRAASDNSTAPSTQQLVIQVVPEPVIVSFTATPEIIMQGSPSTIELEWEVIGADSGSISIDNNIGTVAAKGKRTVSNVITTTDYKLTASNSSGPVEATATVTATVSGT